MVYINGEEEEAAEGKSLKEFLKIEGYDFTRIAVECNGDIIPKAAYADRILAGGDCLEIVNFVGGG